MVLAVPMVVLAVPMVGAGLSFSGLRTAAELAIVMVIGSTYGWLLALCWPARFPQPRTPTPPASRATLVEYGVRLGAAGPSRRDWVSRSAGTRPSRWYVTGGFTTFITILLLIYGSPDQADGRFLERVGETLVGVAVALVLGVAVPVRRRQRTVDGEEKSRPHAPL
jgi:hypothetical protein